ncbi:MAG TPA: DUF2304 domain-containing protein [Thermoanaerobaculia bacterium]|jgi:hypothetical protein
MTTFQLVILPLLLILAVMTGVAVARHRLTPRVGVAWIVLWLAAAVAIALPESLVRVARFAGIGRPADLVMYVAILAALVGFFLIYLRFRRLEEQITKLVRELALRDSQND